MDPENRLLVSRREFLRNSSLVMAGATLGEISATAQTDILGADDSKPLTSVDKNAPYIRVVMHEADGKPISKERLTSLHARDLTNDPLPQAISSAEGRARVTLAKEPIQLSARLNVPQFGEVYCYADNNGKGYTKQENVEFVVEAAATRLRRVREYLARNPGLPTDAEFDKHLAAAARPISKKTGPEQIAQAYESLAHGLHAGEQLVLSAARQRISKFAAPRKDFLFGCLSSIRNRPPEVQKLFFDAFNFAPMSWYIWKNETPPEAQIEYSRMDESFQWCVDHKIVPKGYGYVYLANGATPEWLRKLNYAQVLPTYKRIVAQTMKRYSGRLPYVEVINEAHDKANLFRFSHEQILELTREACRAAREGSPTVKRQINSCCPWAEYAKRPNADGVRRWSPFRYLSDCIKTGTEFEIVGLQLYYPKQDLFETERMLDRFKAFKRPIHITEISCNSVDGLDPASMRPKNLEPGWHGPWTETMQADWLEAIYTICYSKPEFESIGWWDFADYGGHFWPHGGLLRKDFTPKESYNRLLKLQKDWGVKKA